MNTYPPDPLTPEERELAQLTARLGPHGEPSPALDARILSAAHAAVGRQSVRKPRPRWPVAMGLAASVVFAVGIAWQLRPVQQAATVAEAPVAYSGMEQQPAAAAVESVAAPAQAADAAAEAPKADASDMAAAAPSSAAADTAFSPPPVVASAKPLPPRQRPRPAARTVAPPTPEVMRESQVSGSYSRAAMASTPPPPPASPAPVASAPAPAKEPALSSFVSDPEVGAAEQEQRAAGIQGYNARAATAKQAAGHSEMKANAAARERETESRALDRVEVTGSRINRTDLQVPVSNDAQLAVEEWLERVRTRYGLGDAGAAKQSLLLFVKDHPGEPIPDDLEPLLDE